MYVLHLYTEKRFKKINIMLDVQIKLAYGVNRINNLI